MKQEATNRPVRHNRITPNPRRWTLARIPANARAVIDAEAAKWRISTGDAIARLIEKGVAA